MKQLIFLFLLLFIGLNTSIAQRDSTKHNWPPVSFHFQQTLIGQQHTRIKSPYVGVRSLLPSEQMALSMTATFFLAISPWKNANIIFNPELAGGRGLSSSSGIAGFPNGECFRVGNPTPTPYLARLVIEQYINIGKNKATVAYDNAVNQAPMLLPQDYIKFFGGKFCLADYLDNNNYSHDPRTQFFNWALMSAGAYDYAANTRGYTLGIGTTLKKGSWKTTFIAALVPKEANGLALDYNIGKAMSFQLEVAKSYTLFKQPGTIRLIGFYNKANMGNYKMALQQMPTGPDITATRSYNNTKWGGVVNIAQALNDNLGLFMRLSANDGQNETWAFTEIDHSASIGTEWKPFPTKRPNDCFGAALVVNGISKAHQNYLKAGGIGFIVGDGNLNYSPETIAETYYRFMIWKGHIGITANYQFVANPAYNADRGPAHIFALRVHTEF